MVPFLQDGRYTRLSPGPRGSYTHSLALYRQCRDELKDVPQVARTFPPAKRTQNS